MSDTPRADAWLEAHLDGKRFISNDTKHAYEMVQQLERELAAKS